MDGGRREGLQAADRKLVEQFDAYEAVAGKTVNGKLTLGENIADLGGLKSPTRRCRRRPRASRIRRSTA